MVNNSARIRTKYHPLSPDFVDSQPLPAGRFSIVRIIHSMKTQRTINSLCARLDPGLKTFRPLAAFRVLVTDSNPLVTGSR